MTPHLEKIIGFAHRLDLEIIQTNGADELIVVNAEEKGVFHLILDCEDPILVMEQLIYDVKKPSLEHFTRLLQMNRSLVHGAFILDEKGERVIFRDTLQIENLDFNEFEGTINALTLGLAEFSTELMRLNN
ncbi:MAG: molecular chaperone Tir [SAR324 cluster bacterium]|nr:molecular chaperone Tir [SAR324 cluster bacterium]